MLLLPYSVIGPFAGLFSITGTAGAVLVVANTLRALLVGLVSAVIATAPDTAVLISALIVTGASRFVASGMSAVCRTWRRAR